MKTLIFEQWQGGHYFNYLECLVPRLASISDEVVVAITESAAGSALFAQQLGHLRALDNVHFDTGVVIPQARSELGSRWRMGRNLADSIQRHRPDWVFLPSADEQLLALPLNALAGLHRGARSIPVEAVIHYKAYTAAATLRERLVSKVQRQLLRAGAFSRLNFVNFLQYEDAVDAGFGLAGMARVAGDPVPQPLPLGRVESRVRLGLDPEGRYIGMIGGLDERKAVPATLAAFASAGLPHSDRLLLAGKLLPAYESLIAEQYTGLVSDGRLVVMNRFLSHDELPWAFAAVDTSCNVYESFAGLSSLTLKSLAANTPVIVAQKGWSHAVVRRFGVGLAADHQDAKAYASTLRQALDTSGDYRRSDAVDRLLRFHSSDNFAAGLVAQAAAFAKRPVSETVLSWDWVLDAVPSHMRRLR